jgi:hypothetical protein
MDNIDNSHQTVVATSQITTKTQLIEKIQKWVLIDSQLKIINEKTKKLRDMKNGLTEEICHYKSNNPFDNTIRISDGELKFYEKKETTPLSFSYIEKSLAKLIADKTQLEYVIKYLKENRETTTSIDIRRVYKNK